MSNAPLMIDTRAELATATTSATTSATAGGKPDLLLELAEMLARHLAGAGIEAALAAATAETVAEQVREEFGGQVIYVPKGASFKTQQRWAQIWADFTGHNHAELARKYGMGVHGIYRVLAIKRAEWRKRSQPDMFEAANPAKDAE